MDDEFIQYCELNNIEDVEKLAKETFNKGFLQLKYGWAPQVNLIPKPVPPPSQIIKEGKDSKDILKTQKEDITDTQIESNVIVPLSTQSVPKSPQKDLYDE